MKYILILILLVVFTRFLNGLVRLGSKSGGSSTLHGRQRSKTTESRNPVEGREVEDAEFEILPPQPEEPTDNAAG